MVERPDGTFAYTRDGSFKVSVDDDERYLVTSEGYYVLSSDEEPILIDEGITDIAIAEDGTITGKIDEEIEEIGQIALVKFLNPEALLAVGNNLFEETQASGEPIFREDETDTGYGRILQSYLEYSNVR